ncbi:Oxidoreductase [Enterobacter hormaechei]|nr:Oxidoreductase [Enterobacter hormaechei]
MLMGHRDEHRFNESFFAPLFRILPGNWKSIEARDVALAMLKEALAPSQEGVNIIPSAKLGEIAQGEA